jgi:phage-related protein
MKYRTIYFYREYFESFFGSLVPGVKRKVIWTLKLLQELEIIPTQYLKHLDGTDGLYEVRVVHGRHAYRIFCFFDEGRIIVLTTGFQKKTRKTPRKELKRAIKIKQDYEKENATN